MIQLDRRTFLLAVGGAGVLGAAGAVGIWPYRAYVIEKFRAGDFDPPAATLPYCTPGSMDSSTKERLTGHLARLVAALHFPALEPADFSLMIDLKCEAEPSYRLVYEDYITLTAAIPLGAKAFLSVLVERALAGGVKEAQSLRYVVKEALAFDYMKGGFRALGLTNTGGYMAGGRGYRQSIRERADMYRFGSEVRP